jgi:phage terminase small subunit
MMTARKERFAAEYLVDLNATQAAIRSGYSPKTARAQGARLLTDVDVSRVIAVAKEARAQRVEIDADWVVSRLKRVAERCLEAEPVLEFDPAEKTMVHKQAMVEDPETGEQRIVGVYQFDSKGANGALKLLGEHLGIYVKKVEHEGGLTVTHTVDRPPNETREEWLERVARERGLPPPEEAGA